MRYSRIGLWAVAATVAVAVTTTVVATATGAAGRDVLTEEGVADALAAVGPAGGAGARSAPVGADETSANSAESAEETAPGDEKLLQTSAGDIVASCEKDGLTIHSVAPKPGYRVMMVQIGSNGAGKALRWTSLVKAPADAGVWMSVVKGGEFAFVFDKASSEVSIKVALTCVDGVPMAKESEIVKNYGAGKG